MHAPPSPVRRLRLVLALGLLIVSGPQEIRAQPLAFYYWKDVLGACPLACDNSRFGCPCRRNYCQVVNGDLKCGF